MSIFLNPNYKAKLTYTTQTPTQTEVEAVITELLSKMKFKIHIESIECRFLKGAKAIRIHPLHTQTVKDQLYKIACTGPGMELFQRLNKVLDQAPALKITNKEKVSKHSSIRQEIIYDPNNIRYYVSRNSAGEIILVRKPPEVTLAHECIHALHYFEDKKAHYDRRNAKPVMIDMTNAEEQLTITGLGNAIPAPQIQGSKIKANATIVDRVCENSFLFAFGLPPRISHVGTQGRYTFNEIVNVNAIGTLKEILASNPSFATTKIDSQYPYEIAQDYGRTEMAELLRIS